MENYHSRAPVESPRACAALAIRMDTAITIICIGLYEGRTPLVHHARFMAPVGYGVVPVGVRGITDSASITVVLMTAIAW